MQTQEEKSAFELEAERIAREEQEAKDREENKGSGNFEVLKYQELPEKVEVVGRIVGRPPAMRKLPSDVKRVFKSEILTDKGGQARIIWPQELDVDGKETGKLDESFIMHQIYDKVMEKRWDDTIDHITKSGKKGKYVFLNEKTESYKWVKDNQPQFSQFSVRFLPPQNGEFVMNFITRMSDVCKETKHSVLLSRKGSHWIGKKDGKPKEKYEIGLTKDLYDTIWSSVGAVHRHWDLDIVITKKSQKDAAGKTDVSYTVSDASDPRLPKHVRELFAKVPNIIDLPNGDRCAEKIPLTEEEASYELYDLDKLFAPSTYEKIKKNFSKRIALVDVELGTNFMQLLEIGVKKELEAKKAKGSTSTDAPAHEEEEAESQTGDDDDDIPF